MSLTLSLLRYHAVTACLLLIPYTGCHATTLPNEEEVIEILMDAPRLRQAIRVHTHACFAWKKSSDKIDAKLKHKPAKTLRRLRPMPAKTIPKPATLMIKI